MSKSGAETSPNRAEIGPIVSPLTFIHSRDKGRYEPALEA